MVETFYETSDNLLYTLKFILLDHFVEDFKTIGTITALEDSPLEQYNLRINLSHRETSKRHSTIIDETMGRTYSHPTPPLHDTQKGSY